MVASNIRAEENNYPQQKKGNVSSLLPNGTGGEIGNLFRASNVPEKLSTKIPPPLWYPNDPMSTIVNNSRHYMLSAALYCCAFCS